MKDPRLAQIAKLDKQIEQHRNAMHELGQAKRAIITDMRSEYSVRELAKLLGISPGRVQALTDGD